MTETLTMKSGGLDARRYFRRWGRNEVNLPAKVEILTGQGRKFTGGTAVIRDVSLRGALLTQIKLKKSCLPAANFKVRLTFSSTKYKGIGALCRPIRFGRGEAFELAVEFEDFWAQTAAE
ncbi:MAG: hypothetical protein HY293_03260 [Planctomycetes bacterium]|nr:hypothetical protein [Planctomycetota bacterium]